MAAAGQVGCSCMVCCSCCDIQRCPAMRGNALGMGLPLQRLRCAEVQLGSMKWCACQLLCAEVCKGMTDVW